jgi:hypothetical protein
MASHKKWLDAYMHYPDIPIEVTITEPRPRFSGACSDVYIGRFNDKIVRLLDALLGNARLMLAFRWL